MPKDQVKVEEIEVTLVEEHTGSGSLSPVFLISVGFLLRRVFLATFLLK